MATLEISQADFSKAMPHVVDKLLKLDHIDEPTASNHDNSDLRFGTKGSLSVNAEDGTFYDHEAGKGGGVIDLICSSMGKSKPEAIDWLKNEGLLPEQPKNKVRGRINKPKVLMALLERCSDPEGSAVEDYLVSRGLNISGAWPDSIRLIKQTENGCSSLAAIATDKDGVPMAIQQVFLEPRTGEKRSGNGGVFKRTNSIKGWSGKSVVRLPGKSPTVICEGVENALSVWLATEQECWATLGISNLKNVDVSDIPTVIVCGDGDALDKPAAHTLQKALNVLSDQAGDVLNVQMPLGQDANDVLINSGPKALQTLVNDAGRWERCKSSWQSLLACSVNGKPIANLANVLVVLRHAEEWVGVFVFDSFQQKVLVSEQPPAHENTSEVAKYPEFLTDGHVIGLQEWLQREGLPTIGVEPVHAAIKTVAAENSIHPIRDYLRRLEWDGKHRLDKWLHTYCGAEDGPYASGIGRMFLIAMVARVNEPGCKADYMLIFEGRQGAGKSKVCQILAGEYFSDCLPNMHSKDAQSHLNGNWLIEIAELQAMSKAEDSTLKAFVTRRAEKFRPAYGREEITVPRQCVFIGTTNDSAYLRDPTGARRFWPITVNNIDLDALISDRDQLFAEAFALYMKGERWWPDAKFEREFAKQEQDARHENDVWEPSVIKYLEGRSSVFIVDVLSEAIDMPKAAQRRMEQNRISAILRRAGWERSKSRKNNGTPWVKK